MHQKLLRFVRYCYFRSASNRAQWSTYFKFPFLVACDATLHPALSVRRSVGPSVRPSHFTFLGVLRFLASLLLPKWWSDLNYGPCPPARDWGSRVSGLVRIKPPFLLLPQPVFWPINHQLPTRIIQETKKNYLSSRFLHEWWNTEYCWIN